MLDRLIKFLVILNVAVMTKNVVYGLQIRDMKQHNSRMVYICDSVDGSLYYNSGNKIMYSKDNKNTYTPIRDDYGDVERYYEGRVFE